LLDDTYGHTPARKAFDLMDVYGIGFDHARSSRSKIRLLIIGMGGVAQSKYLPAISRLRMIWEPLELAAFAEPREDQGRKVQELTGARWYRDYRQMLVEEDAQGVLVLGPDDLHAEDVVACLEAGRHVVVEKPISRSLVDAQKMCRLADEKSLTLMTVATMRYSPPYRRAKSLIAKGPVSNPALFVGKFNLGYNYVDLLESGTIHLFDLTRHFIGDVAAVRALGLNKYQRGPRHYPLDNLAASFEFKSGAIGSLYSSSSALSFKPWVRVEVYGDHAWLSVEDQHELLLYDSEEGPTKSWKPIVTNTLLFDEEFGGFMGLVENFLQAIRGSEKPLVTGWDGYQAFELAVACHLSLACKGVVRLPLDASLADEELRAWLRRSDKEQG
jgi:predicted dehydrogenase